MSKESITLPDILRVLGDRPYPLKENVREYLQELEERKVKEDEKKETDEKAAAANTPLENEPPTEVNAEESQKTEEEAINKDAKLESK